MPEALISMTTSRGPGVGSGKSRSSSCRLPRKTTPCMANLLTSNAVDLLTHVPAAVGRDHLSGHVLCLVAGEVDRRPGNVIGLAQAPEWRLRRDAVAQRPQGRRHVG